jgi:diguanylate cyclase (GGDEF)-like protein
MVKKTTTINKISDFFIDSLKDEDADYALHLENLVDMLIYSGYCQSIILKKSDDSIFVSRSNSQDSHGSSNLEIYSLNSWGTLTIDRGSVETDEGFNFWQEMASKIALYLISAEIKLKTSIIGNVSSEIRKTLKPDLALEKIFTSFKDYLGIKDFYFFKKILNSEDNYDGNIFKGYSLFFHSSESTLDSTAKSRLKDVLQLEDIREINFVENQYHKEIFSSKVRGREWGVLLISKEKAWTDDEKTTFSYFMEQLATVFNQHELHSESLTTAQREFLLNQITTKIRESLVVDFIADTAVKEIAQVMGVESCGLIILDRKIRGRLGHRVWSIESEMDGKMLDGLYSILKTKYEPSWASQSVVIKRDEIEADFNLRAIKKAGFKTLMASGLFNDTNKELMGIVIVSFFENNRAWTYDEQQLLEGACKQLEIALTQASIYQEAQQTKRQMALLHKLSNDIRDSLDISIVIGQIAKGIGEVLGLSRCFVRRFSERNRILKTEEEYCSKNFTKTADLIFSFEKEWIETLAEKEDPSKSFEMLNIASIMTEFEETNPELLKIAKAIELKSYLAVPLIARGKVLGTINVHQCDRERVFLQEEIEFIFRVASEAAIALEHAALFETINTFNKIDPDTGLYNKKYFKELSVREIKRSKESGKDISMMLIDVDHLKTINDDKEFGGHDAGDEAIQTMAEVLSKTLRQTPVDEVNKRISDLVGRFGGDEFMVLLPDTSIEEAIRAAQRVHQNLSKTKLSTWPKPLTCSIGIASAKEVGYSYEVIQTSADKALYLSKEKGRDAITACTEL